MQLILEALKDLRAHRGRSLLSGISLFVGIMAVVGIYTVGAIVQDVFVANAEQRSGRAVTIETQIPATTLLTHDVAQIADTLYSRIVTRGGYYAMTADINATIEPPSGQELGQPLTLVAGNLDQIRRLPLMEGHWFASDTQVYPGGLVLNMAARARYGGLGSHLKIRINNDFQSYPQPVIGVVADGNTAPAIYQSLLSTLAYQPGVLPTGFGLNLFVHGPAAEADLRDLIADTAHDLRIDPSEVEIHRSDTVDELNGSLQTATTAFLGIAVATLAVAALGLVNIGFATVRDRRRELTIRRASGATRTRMFSLVLLSAVLIGLFAAIAAIGCAMFTVLLVVPHLLSPSSAVQAPAFPYGAGLAGLIAALGASLCGGIAPAIAAARVDMAFALRE
jgi:hypothetical protein